MRIKMILVCLAALVLVSEVSANGRRSRRSSGWSSSESSGGFISSSQAAVNEAATKDLKGCDDALKEVNEYRIRNGLRPFLPDALLNKAAQACAKQRAARLIKGHLPESDFTYAPPGCDATAAGCGAMDDSWGWRTCCMEGNYTYAGAAWYRGANGERFMHLFVR